MWHLPIRLSTLEFLTENRLLSHAIETCENFQQKMCTMGVPIRMTVSIQLLKISMNQVSEVPPMYHAFGVTQEFVTIDEGADTVPGFNGVFILIHALQRDVQYC